MMTDVNRTLFIPLYGKATVSKKHIILKDPDAERIWEAEAFPIRGKSRSRWLCYNMAMRARIFDDWTERMLKAHPDAIVLHVGCGLDSRCRRVGASCEHWYDCDFPDVIAARKEYFDENEKYSMTVLDASDPEQLEKLPDHETAVVILEGISMYLTNAELHDFFGSLRRKYASLHILVDVYTEFGAKASAYKNPINDVGVTKVYGVDDMEGLTGDLDLKVWAEHSLTPPELVGELKGAEKTIFRMLFTGKMYRRIYRLYELRASS